MKLTVQDVTYSLELLSGIHVCQLTLTRVISKEGLKELLFSKC